MEVTRINPRLRKETILLPEFLPELLKVHAQRILTSDIVHT